MANNSHFEYAQDILKAYRQVDDKPLLNNRLNQQSRLFQKNKELETELQTLQEKYSTLQHELSNREERLARLNRQLNDRTLDYNRLQQDYENAIEQMRRSPL